MTGPHLADRGAPGDITEAREADRCGLVEAVEQRLPQRAKQLDRDVNEEDLHLPELMDFGSRKTTTLTAGSR
jgi:hypothetical protein